MKCWKCGKEIPDGASMCTYCSASMNRKAPATPAGKAMRQIYDRFGSGRVFDKKSILSIALGDMLEDSKKIRSQIDMVMSAGVGGVYLNQLQNVGKPDSAFCDKIKKLMADYDMPFDPAVWPEIGQSAAYSTIRYDRRWLAAGLAGTAGLLVLCLWVRRRPENRGKDDAP